MTEKDYILTFIHVLPILIIWLRLESRISRLEGRFDMFMQVMCKNSGAASKGHGTLTGG